MSIYYSATLYIHNPTTLKIYSKSYTSENPCPIVSSVICKNVPWPKVSSLCDMSVFIHVAFENVFTEPVSIYNMGIFTWHMPNFMNVMCKLISDMLHLLCANNIPAHAFEKHTSNNIYLYYMYITWRSDYRPNTLIMVIHWKHQIFLSATRQSFTTCFLILLKILDRVIIVQQFQQWSSH